MPLSEQEQRLLDEMERHLMSNDTDVVTAPSRALSYRNIVLGSILVLAGLGALVVGVSIGFNTALDVALDAVDATAERRRWWWRRRGLIPYSAAASASVASSTPAGSPGAPSAPGASG